MNNSNQFNEYLEKFRYWLKSVKKFKNSTVSARVSNLKTISEYYDVFKEFSIDECKSLFDELKLSRGSAEPKTAIVINGDYYNGLTTYRQTVKLFVAFLKAENYVAPTVDASKSARFIGSFDDFKRYIGPKCRNNVNIFCKSERAKHKGICEWCGGKHELQSAHIKERLVIMKEILADYRIGDDWYDVDIEEFLLKFKNAHLPIQDHIFFLCKSCHDMLDKSKSISVDDIRRKRETKQ